MTRLYRVNPPSRRNSLSLVTDTYDRQDTNGDGVTDSATNVRAAASLAAWAKNAAMYAPKLWASAAFGGNDAFQPYYEAEVMRTGLGGPPVPEQWRTVKWLTDTPISNMSKDERLFMRALESALGKRPTGAATTYTMTTPIAPKMATAVATATMGVAPKVALAAAALVLVALVAKKLRKKRKKKAA